MRFIFALVAFTSPAFAGCLEREETFMSCDIADSAKILSVCFDETDVHYRFGEVWSVPELTLSDTIARVNYVPWSGVGRNISEGVTFYSGAYSYEVYAGFERMFGDEEFEDVPFRHFGGVRVQQGTEAIASLSCARDSVTFVWGEGLFAAKQNLGLTWDDRAFEWVELPD